MKKSSAYLAILICLIGYTATVHAEPEQDTPKSEQASNEKIEKKMPKQTVTTKKPLKEFTPSEEISIDKSVAFPVDI